VCKGKGHIIPGASRRNREQQPNENADNGRAHDGEGVLPDDECETTRNETNDHGP
jgi:hypothetical protein